MQRVKRFLRLAIFATGLITFVLVVILPMGVAYLYVEQVIAQPCGNRPVPLSERMEGVKPFTFAPEPGMELEGWLATGTNGAGIIILAGAYGGSNTMYTEMQTLHAAGYTVMTYDTRSCANPPHHTSLGYDEKADLKAALALMLQQPEVEPDKIGVFGYSMGGATAIMTAAEDQRIKAVIASGNYATLDYEIHRDQSQQGLFERWQRGWVERWYEWRTGLKTEQSSPISVIGQISPRPVFLIHGANEIHLSLGTAQFDAAGEPKEFWLVEGAGHGGYPAVAREEYDQRPIDFFNHYLLGQGQ